MPLDFGGWGPVEGLMDSTVRGESMGTFRRRLNTTAKKITRRDAESLARSLVRRIRAIYAARGGNTRD